MEVVALHSVQLLEKSDYVRIQLLWSPQSPTLVLSKFFINHGLDVLSNLLEPLVFNHLPESSCQSRLCLYKDETLDWILRSQLH